MNFLNTKCYNEFFKYNILQRICLLQYFIMNADFG